MRKLVMDGSATACYMVRCCALGTAVYAWALSLRRFREELGGVLPAVLDSARQCWLSLVELMEQDDSDIEPLLFQGAASFMSDVAALLDSHLISRGELPWSCQSLEYMRLSSATYAPLSLEGDAFQAYWEYFHDIQGRLREVVDGESGLSLVRSIQVIASCALETMERRLRDERLAFKGDVEASCEPVELRLGAVVPQCKVCGHLMLKGMDGAWACPNCS